MHLILYKELVHVNIVKNWCDISPCTPWNYRSGNEHGNGSDNNNEIIDSNNVVVVKRSNNMICIGMRT
jgi:hypothetical protein